MILKELLEGSVQKLNPKEKAEVNLRLWRNKLKQFVTSNDEDESDEEREENIEYARKNVKKWEQELKNVSET